MTELSKEVFFKKKKKTNKPVFCCLCSCWNIMKLSGSYMQDRWVLPSVIFQKSKIQTPK